MGVTESQRESGRDRKRFSKSQREPVKAGESLREQVRARGSQSGSYREP